MAARYLLKAGKQFRNIIKQKSLLEADFLSLCGESRIRTCEDVVSRFTVCPRWPLEYLPKTDRKYIIVFNSTKQKTYFFLQLVTNSKS